jgi:hypothetical protein
VHDLPQMNLERDLTNRQRAGQPPPGTSIGPAAKDPRAACPRTKNIARHSFPKLQKRKPPSHETAAVPKLRCSAITLLLFYPAMRHWHRRGAGSIGAAELPGNLPRNSGSRGSRF